MKDHCPEGENHLIPYFEKNLPQEMSAHFEAHLRECPTCRIDLVLFQEQVIPLALAAEIPVETRILKEISVAVMARVQSAPQAILPDSETPADTPRHSQTALRFNLSLMVAALLFLALLPTRTPAPQEVRPCLATLVTTQEPVVDGELDRLLTEISGLEQALDRFEDRRREDLLARAPAAGAVPRSPD